MNQLYAEEFAATITVEVSHNLDLLAEARQRPRPNTVHADVVGDDDALTEGHRGKMNETLSDDAGEEYDAEIVQEEPFSMEVGVVYKPRFEIQDHEVLAFAHRLQALQQQDGRGRRACKENVEKFRENYCHFYDAELCRTNAVLPPGSETGRGDLANGSLADRIACANRMLQSQKNLADQRAAIKKVGAQEAGSTDEEDGFGKVHSHHTQPLILSVAATSVAATQSPAHVARRLVCISGSALDRQQYEMVLLCISPLQELWDYALRTGRLEAFNSVPRCMVCVCVCVCVCQVRSAFCSLCLKPPPKLEVLWPRVSGAWSSQAAERCAGALHACICSWRWRVREDLRSL